jgi:hypothetical protein
MDPRRQRLELLHVLLLLRLPAPLHVGVQLPKRLLMVD